MTADGGRDHTAFSGFFESSVQRLFPLQLTTCNLELHSRKEGDLS